MKINPLKSKSKFNTIILAAGKGSRIRRMCPEVPKPLISINGVVAIDFLIEKFKDITERFIICTGYEGQVVEKYLQTEHPNIKFKFVRQDVDELARGPGKSAILGLNAANSKLPTIFLFCDILFEDVVNVEHNGLGLYKAIDDNKYVVGRYKTIGKVYRKYVEEITQNLTPDTEGGWMGLAVIHNTVVLKQIVNSLLAEKDINQIDYSMDMMGRYVKYVKTRPLPISRLYEFGTTDTLRMYN